MASCNFFDWDFLACLAVLRPISNRCFNTNLNQERVSVCFGPACSSGISQILYKYTRQSTRTVKSSIRTALSTRELQNP